MRLEFIKNVAKVKVDGLRGINSYTIKAMYDEIGEDGFASIVYKPVDSFQLTWDEIERDGGIAQVKADLAEVYGVID